MRTRSSPPHHPHRIHRVFGMFATIDKALSQYGVHTDGVGTTDFVGIGLTRPCLSTWARPSQLSVEDTYQRFVGLVGRGRGLSPEEAESRRGPGLDGSGMPRIWDWWTSSAIWTTPLKAAAELANLKRWQVTP